MSAGHNMTCGACGRTWNDEETPTPAARCPYEYEHAEEGEKWEITIVIRGVATTFHVPIMDEDETKNDVTYEIMESAEIFVSKV